MVVEVVVVIAFFMKMVDDANSDQEDGESSYQEISFIETKTEENVKTNIVQHQGELYGHKKSQRSHFNLYA